MIISFSNYLACRLVTRAIVPRSFVIAVIALSASTGSAQTIEMTKIVCRRSGPDVAPDSVDAKPITIYKAGDKYCRREYQSDPAHGTQMLNITKEPDDWSINLADHTAVHRLDRGPTFNVRLHIFWTPKPPGQRDPDEIFRELEFGNEADFFRKNRARDLGLRKIDGKDAKAFTIKSGAREVTLFLDSQTEKPVQIDVIKDGKPEISFHYLTYQSGLPFDPSLFEIPEGLKITEAK